MKTKLCLLIMLLFSTMALAQNGINYKAVIKDGSGNVVANDLILVQFTILKTSATGTMVYQENHSPTTDDHGMIILNIGEATPISGVFTDIDWVSDAHFLNVQINSGGGLVDLGTTQFKTVPYALNTVTRIDNLSDAKSDNDGTQDGSSLFLGWNAGVLDDGTDNQNTGIGFNALQNNTTGHRNVANGYQALYSNTTGIENTANGRSALFSNTEGEGNVANGSYALYLNTGSFNTATGFATLADNTTGGGNTATGFEALNSNTTGYWNTANGYQALYSNTTGFNNLANGYHSLYSNTTGAYNTANGYNTLRNNTTGEFNLANGHSALSANTTGHENTANGFGALYRNTTGSRNTANGYRTLHFNSEGEYNTGNGHEALYRNTTGNLNTANGYQALYSNTTGGQNIANGYRALYSNTNGYSNVANGLWALSNNIGGSWNTANGNYALNANTTGSNNIGIGNHAQVPDGTLDNQVRIGNTDITYAGVQVAWDITSDKRWKEQIRELPYGLDLVMQLKPVDYIRKNSDKKTREMGLIAQDVEAVLNKIGYTDQGLLNKDDKGYMSLRYNDLIALLTKAIQEQQEIINTHNQEIKTLKNKNIELEQLLVAYQTIEDRLYALENTSNSNGELLITDSQ